MEISTNYSFVGRVQIVDEYAGVMGLIGDENHPFFRNTSFFQLD